MFIGRSFIMMKLVIYCLLGVFFIGCASTKTNKVVYEEYKPQKITTPTQVYAEKKKKDIVENIPISGMVKGKVVKVVKINTLWKYEVKGEDISNHKLSYAKFTSSNIVAKKGDFVYAVIKDGILQEIYLIKKANFKTKETIKIYKKKKIVKVKSVKRVKKHQIIGVPTVESISLD
jgi:hypothetical protein